MVNCIIDGKKMCSRAEAHDELALALNLSRHYGRNLDALWDEISTMEAHVTLINRAAMLESLGTYGEKLLQTFRDAEANCPRFTFVCEDR